MKIDLPSDKPEYVSEDRAEAIKSVLEDFPDVETRFTPGSYGHFELLDRSSVAMENWFQYIQDHPSVVLDEELYVMAHQIGTALHDFYQKVATLELDTGQVVEGLAIGRFLQWSREHNHYEVEALVHKYLNSCKKEPEKKKNEE